MYRTVLCVVLAFVLYYTDWRRWPCICTDPVPFHTIWNYSTTLWNVKNVYW
jgi:hypothetical protein